MSEAGGRPGRAELIALAGILAVAAVLRFWKLGEVPFGMHPDEGHNALDALRIADGWRPAFLPGNNGREALFMYLMSVPVAVAGPTVAAVRSTAAVCGVALVAAQWLMVRSLGYSRAPRVALVSAALVAVGFWPVAQSRYGLRAVLLSVWVALLVWAWWKVLSGPRVRFAPAAATGLFVGLAALTHLTGRILLAIPAVAALGELAARRGVRAVGAWGLAAVVAAAVAAPEIVYFANQPEMVTYRSDQVSITNPEVNEGSLAGALVENGVRLAETPVLKGDGSWYHNLRHRPVFDLAVGIAFLGGVALLAADAAGRNGSHGRRRALLLLTTLAVTVLPSALSEGAPNYVRMTGVIPVLFLLPALALDAAADWLDRWLGRGLAWQDAGQGHEPGLAHADAGTVPSRARSGTGTIFLAGVLGLSAAWTIHDYFLVYARAPETYDAFNGAAVERGQLLSGVIAGTSPDTTDAATTDAATTDAATTDAATTDAAPGTETIAQSAPDTKTVAQSPPGTETGRTAPARAVYVTPALWNQSVIRFLNHERPPTSFDPRAGLVLPPLDKTEGTLPASATTAFYAFDPVEKDAVDAFALQWPRAELTELKDSRGEPSLYVFEMPGSPWRDGSKESGTALGASGGGNIPVAPGTWDDEVSDYSGAVFGGLIALNSLHCAFDTESPGPAVGDLVGDLATPGSHGVIAVTLEWTALGPTPTDLNFFVRVSDGDSEIGQWDGPPLEGSYGTHEWQPGERILQTVRMPLNEPSPQSCSVTHGWYDWRNGMRLDVPGSADDSVMGTWVR